MQEIAAALFILIPGGGRQVTTMKESTKQIFGHAAAFITAVGWGGAFVFVKPLLSDFNAIEVQFFRMILTYLVLFAAKPGWIGFKNMKHEICFALAGFTGMLMGCLLQNVALTFTMTANVGALTCVAPFFTALFAWLFLKEKRPGLGFFLGFVVSMAGVFLISFGGTKVRLNFIGDMLALLAAVALGSYSVWMKKISTFGYHPIQAVRRMVTYAIILAVPFLFVFQSKMELSLLFKSHNFFYIMLLGAWITGVGSIMWNFSVRTIGAVKASTYIYLEPVVAVLMACLWGETLSVWAIVGIVLAMAGLLLSQFLFKKRSSGIEP